MREGKALKLKGDPFSYCASSLFLSLNRFCLCSVANFNLLNFHEPNVPFYQYKQGLSEEQVEAKIEWTASQLRRMNAAVVGFQEIFSLVPLVEAAKRAGYDMSKTHIISPSCDGKGPAVGLLSTYPIVEYQTYIDFPPEAHLDLSGDSGGPPVFLPVTQFSRPVLRVVIEIETGHRLAVYVTHLKSKRPVIKDKSLQKDLKMNAIGSAISLTIRAAEAAALRCVLLDELAGDQEGLRDIAQSSIEKKAPVAYVAPGAKHLSGTTGANPSAPSLEVKIAELNISKDPPSPRRSSSPKRGSSPARSNSPRRGRKRQDDDPDSTQTNKQRTPSIAGSNIATTKQYPTIVMGDLNDITHAVSTEILSGTPPFKRLPFWEKEILWRTLLYSAHDVQARTSDRDINYTYIHNGRYECLDNILISNALVRNNNSHIGYVQYVQCFNDHLVDQALAEDDDDEDSPLTRPRLRGGSSRPQSRASAVTPHAPLPAEPKDACSHQGTVSSPTSATAVNAPSPSLGFRPAKLRGRDVTKSDHGQVVALLKIFPKNLGPESEYACAQNEEAKPSDYFMRRQRQNGRGDPAAARTPSKKRYGEDGMADASDGEEENHDVPERLRKHKGHHKPSAEVEDEEEGDIDAEEIANVYYAHTGDSAGRALKPNRKHP
ncbi:Endonuclease/exonuclease/phosphatase [Obelidium mucronatum]|nr:Endonuclease/exonuclease/phosphatase [Obelidium mucronatum]